MKTQDMTPGRQGYKPSKSELYEWLDKQILCVIATLGEGGYPNTATVAFSQSEEMEFVIITDESSRKATNIDADGRVAMTITNESDRFTVQLEGGARRLSWEEFKKYDKHHYEKLPYSLPFKDLPGQAPFVIVPTNLKFSDVNVHPWEVTKII